MSATKTSEKPILFSGPMVRAILDGRKTQTRRVVKPQPVPIPDDVWQSKEHDNGWWWAAPGVGLMIDVPSMCPLCPYGQPGDRLWVRETWMPVGAHPDPGSNTGRCFYRSDYFEHEWADLARDAGRRWRPSIHMPRWASRITLEVVSVRVEHIQEMSPPDSVAEGFCGKGGGSYWSCDPATGQRLDIERYKYIAQRWDAINAARGFGWDANPWVWVVEFKRTEAA